LRLVHYGFISKKDYSSYQNGDKSFSNCFSLIKPINIYHHLMSYLLNF
jgi:hypothetical protein